MAIDFARLTSQLFNERAIMTDWHDRSVKLHGRFMDNARAVGELTTPQDEYRFLAFAICGEAGELANLIKKAWRGDQVNGEEWRAKVIDEMADIRIYLDHLADCFGCDLDEACRRKLAVVEKRLDAKDQVARIA